LLLTLLRWLDWAHRVVASAPFGGVCTQSFREIAARLRLGADRCGPEGRWRWSLGALAGARYL